MNETRNKFRPEENAILIWNLALARTAYVSGKELIALRQWAQDGAPSYEKPQASHPFAKRLIKLGLISDTNKSTILEAIAASATQKSPTNAFVAPESIHIELTGRCPINCPQCYKAGAEADLPLDKLLQVIRQAGEMQVFQIALGGGEPLVYPHLVTAIEETRHYGMAASVTTSGVGLTTNLLAALKNAGLNHIQVSLNGSTNEVHSLSRDGFKHGIAALELLQNTGISYGVNWVARMDNINDFPALANLAKGLGTHNLNILRYKPSPNEPFIDMSLSTDKIVQLEKMIKAIKGIHIKLDSAFPICVAV